MLAYEFILLQDIHVPWCCWSHGNQSESYSAYFVFVHMSGHISCYLLPALNGWA